MKLNLNAKRQFHKVNYVKQLYNESLWPNDPDFKLSLD